MERAVLLSGEHATLPWAELDALLAVHDPGAVVERGPGRVAVVRPGDAAATDDALGRMALAHAWVEPWGREERSPAGLERLAGVVRERADGVGRAAVEAVRTEGVPPTAGLEAEQVLGAALRDAGHVIDLASPEVVVSAWLTGDAVVAGRLLGRSDRAAHAGRQAVHRAHFSPVVLHPRQAAALLHLARLPPGGRVLDPFCGTGTLVLEAALEGFDAWGSDRDPFMVQGTLQALADDGPEPLDGCAFVADVAAVPGLVDGVRGVVTDLPYGSASGTGGEAVPELWRRAFRAFAEVLDPGCRAVFGCHDEAALQVASDSGFEVESVHVQRVHRGLTRRFAVVKRREGVGRVG